MTGYPTKSGRERIPGVSDFTPESMFDEILGALDIKDRPAAVTQSRNLGKSVLTEKRTQRAHARHRHTPKWIRRSGVPRNPEQ
jgi:hypothetical protein